jgi:hypothetical protein
MSAYPDLPISQLPSSPTLETTDLVPVVHGGTTMATTIESLRGNGMGGSGLGWARYDGTTYTTSSVLTVTAGAAAVTLPNNAGSVVNTYLNSSGEFYNGATQKITPENEGDVYSMVVTFKAKSSNANQSRIDLSLSSTGATPYDRVSKTLSFAKENDTWENFYESFHFYSDADFVNSGNAIKISATGTNVSVADVIFFIQRTFNAG